MRQTYCMNLCVGFGVALRIRHITFLSIHLPPAPQRITLITTGILKFCPKPQLQLVLKFQPESTFLPLLRKLQQTRYAKSFNTTNVRILYEIYEFAPLRLIFLVRTFVTHS